MVQYGVSRIGNLRLDELLFALDRLCKLDERTYPLASVNRPASCGAWLAS